jgi:two-component system C4-dicarboxylate transport sensor histidine kinase DctB
MSGILISTRFAFVMLAGTVSALLILGYLQINNITHPNLFWKSASLGMTDIIMFLTIFIIITLVSWLSNREIEKLLKRAKKSERELKIERDSLEIKVAERTRELKETQMEKMTQIYRFAEFGWLSSGLFHDLINPLNAMSLNMEKVRCQDNNDSVVAETKMYLDKAIAISKRIENFVAAVRRQIARQGKAAIFSLAKEIEQVIEVLAHKAAKANVKIFFSTKAGDVKYFGDAIKFNQIVLNLVANAIDAYALVDPSAGKKRKRDVLVCLREEMGSIILSVEDYGAGIAEDNLNKIFEPFFSTKDSEGMGIGLSMAKRIIEKDFNGLVEVKSELHKGTIFIITIPNKLL